MKISTLISVALLGLAWQASANLVDLGLKTLPSGLGDPSGEAAWIQTELSLSSTPIYLNKINQPPTGGPAVWDNTGAVDSSHFTAPTTLGTTADISWNLTGTGYELNYVLVKDGVDDNKLFLYHLYGVTADQVLVGAGSVTINGQKGISHISFYGNTGASGPDGGLTLALLGLGLSGVWGFARKQK